MKTLLVSAFLAVAISACSSDDSSTLVTGTGGTVPQGSACSQDSDCETGGGLTCAYPVQSDAGTCPSTGVCAALGVFTVETVCPCGGNVYVSANVTPIYSSVAIAPLLADGGSRCAPGASTGSDGGSGSSSGGGAASAGSSSGGGSSSGATGSSSGAAGSSSGATGSSSGAAGSSSGSITDGGGKD